MRTFRKQCSRCVTRTAAPLFTLFDNHGTAHNLESYQGKVVLLNFWAPWCFNCAGELEAFQELKRFLGSEKFEVIAIAEVSPDEAKTFKYNFPLLFDGDKRVADQYRVAMLPATYIIDKAGRIVSFPDPESENSATVFQGPRGWNSLRVARNIEALSGEYPFS